MQPVTTAPLILTLALDAVNQARFTALRTQHFPPERNYLAAHLTLFHALPGTHRATVEAIVQQVVAATAPLELEVSGLLFLGQGVAYQLESAKLRSLHAELQKQFATHFELTPQDQRPLRPHVTVQNKVPPANARALQAELQATFRPWNARGTALQLWEYQGGPWKAIESFELGTEK